jgi:hypothetical protein
MLKLKGLYENTKSKPMMRPNQVKDTITEMKKPVRTDVKSAIDRLILFLLLQRILAMANTLRLILVIRQHNRHHQHK